MGGRGVRARIVFSEIMRSRERVGFVAWRVFFPEHVGVSAADVRTESRTLFSNLTLGLAGYMDEEEDPGEGLIFRDDFAIFDEAQHLGRVASRHIGLNVSSGQIRFNLQRLWNPRTEKGLLSTLRKGRGAAGGRCDRRSRQVVWRCGNRL